MVERMAAIDCPFPHSPVLRSRRPRMASRSTGFRWARIARPADAMPSGNRLPSTRTNDRIGKLPSSRSRHTVSSPRRIDRNADSPVASASRLTDGCASSSIGKRLADADPMTYSSGPTYQRPVASSRSSIPSVASDFSNRCAVGLVRPVRATRSFNRIPAWPACETSRSSAATRPTTWVPRCSIMWTFLGMIPHRNPPVGRAAVPP